MKKAYRAAGMVWGLVLLCPAASGAEADSLDPARAAAPVYEEVVVTAQKRTQSLQDVPIAVSAFSEDDLAARGIDGAEDLVLAVPNLTFTRSSQRTSFQIRGVGTQLTATTGDDGVGIHHNSVPLTRSRAADAEFFDVERVEVLRGPQGTLFGRNATGGIINVITARPEKEFSASLSAELGNYDSIRVRGHLNVPFGDAIALRVAAFGLDRDGYAENTLTGDDVDSRELHALRGTLTFEPSERFRGYMLWEHFEEDDTRGPRKQLCAKDPGRTEVLGVPTGAAQAALTQSCLPASVYDASSFGSINHLGTFPGIIARQFGLQAVDAFAGKDVSRDLRKVELSGRPIYTAETDIVQLNLEWDLTPALTVTSLTGYNGNDTYNRGDFSAVQASVPFGPSPLAPDGTLSDGLFGITDRPVNQSAYVGDDRQWSQELRLQSDFDGPVNFTVGGIYLDLDSRFTAMFASNVATAAVRVLVPTAYVDPFPEPDFTGHNYFVNMTEYRLESQALFGELYWDAGPDLRITLGLRHTDDRKEMRGSGATLFAPGRGPDFGEVQKVRFRELTGRINIDWSPDLRFTDHTLVYASYAKGYKGGGFNPPGVVALGLRSDYAPEFVNAIELGTKNTLLDGRMQVNVTAFHYDYEGYQIARSVNRSIFNENIDATIRGVELESIWRPLDRLQLNANIGYLTTKIRNGHVVDTFNRTRGDDTYLYAASTAGGCILNAAGVAGLLQEAAGPSILANVSCGGPGQLTTALASAGMASDAAAALAAGVYAYGPDVALLASGAGDGVVQNLRGNDLPNAPRWTAALGAQYEWVLHNGWFLALRGDYYRQSNSDMRYNNAGFDRIRSWDNINVSVTLESPGTDLSVNLFVKNLKDDDTVTGFAIGDENVGSPREIILLDPRLFGLMVTKRF